MAKETKQEKFIRLAIKRTNSALEDLRLIGNLSNKMIYEYTDEQVEKIFAAIEAETAAAREKFARDARKKFSLSDD